MEENSLVAYGTPLSAHNECVLIIEQFLTDNYLFRRNVLNGKVEFKTKAEGSGDYRPLTQEALNSLHTFVYGYARLWPTGCSLTRCTATR